MTEKAAKTKASTRRRSLADVDVLEESLLDKRASDTVASYERRTKRVENCLINHLKNHDDDVKEAIKEFMAAENFALIVETLWQHDKIKTAILNAKNQMVGEIVSAIFNNKYLWMFAVVVILLLMGYDLKFIKDLLKTIII